MTDYREFATLLIIAFLLSGCGSKSSFATSSELPNERLMTSTSSEQTGHRILVAATLTLSSRTGEIIIQPYRDLAAHWDVTSYLEPPQCDDCIAIEVEYHDLEMKIIGLNVTLRNPTTYKALDVRAILMPDNGSFEPGVHFLNADAYTELWDDGGQAKRNPFFAFGKNSPLRAFPPGYSEKNLFRISYNSFQDLINLPFVVDASWPGNCSEPFDLEPLSTGTIIADGSTKAHIAVILKSWKLNGDKVSLDLSPLGGDPEWPLTLNPDWCGPYGQLFEGAATVPSGVAAGTYNIWVKGNTSGSKICLWSLMTLHISPGGYPTNPVPVCIFNIGTASSLDLFDAALVANRLSSVGYGGISVYDVTNQESPVLAQNVDPLHFSGNWYYTFVAEQVIDNGELVALRDYMYGIRVYDVMTIGHSDPLLWENQYPVYHMMGEFNNQLYYIHTVDKLNIVDFSIPDNPKQYGPYELEKPPGYINISEKVHLFYKNHYLEFAVFQDSTRRLLVWRVEDIEQVPQLVSASPIESWPGHKPGSIFIVENFLLVTFRPGPYEDGRIYVYDVSDFTSPELLIYIEVNDPLLNWCLISNSLLELGDGLYLFAYSWVFDLNNLPDIQILGKPDMGLSEISVKTTDPERKLAYAWGWYGHGPYVLDTKDPMHWKTIGYYQGLSPETAMYNMDIDSDGIAYGAYLDAGLALINVSDPEHPNDPVILDTPGEALDVWTKDKIAYVADGPTGLLVVDCTDYRHPGVVNILPVAAQATTVNGIGNYLFVGRDWTDVLAFDISIDKEPALKTIISDPGEPIRYFECDGFSFYYRTDHFLGFIDISNPGNIPVAERVEVGPTKNRGGLGVMNGLLLHESSDGIALRDLNLHSLSDPPVAILPIIPEIGGSLSVEGVFGYVYTGGLLIYDLSDPPNPIEVSTLGVFGDAHGKACQYNNYALLPTGSSGLETVKLW